MRQPIFRLTVLVKQVSHQSTRFEPAHFTAVVRATCPVTIDSDPDLSLRQSLSYYEVGQ